MASRSRLAFPVIAALLIIAGVVVVVRLNTDSGAVAPAGTVPRSSRTDGPPNVLVIMTDDQTLESMRVLDNVDRYLIDQGTSFTNYTVAFPNCCPSRATYMSGQYSHNNGIRENVPPAGGYHKFNSNETLQVWLQRSGYFTASVGKYLNEYGQDGNLAPPPGWTHWFGLIDPTTYRYFGYEVSDNGTRRSYGDRPEDYQTDVLGAEVVRVIQERATADEPWFLSWTPLAPHAVEGEGASGQSAGDLTDNSEGGGGSIVDRMRSSLPVPAPEFEGKMAKERLPLTPSFNQKDVSKLPEVIQKKLPIGAKLQGVIREGYQRELEALLSVDKWVKRIVEELHRTNQLANTVVIFTSDNGYFHGEHRLSFSKVHLYEAAVRLPLIIRGGGFPSGAKVAAPAGNVDLAPTILALAGAPRPPLTLDGRDLAPVARDPAAAMDRGMLLENWRNNGQSHSDGIRTVRYKYIVSDRREEELYDLQSDPDETTNLAADPGHTAVKRELAARLDKLRSCAGRTCEGADG